MWSGLSLRDTQVINSIRQLIIGRIVQALVKSGYDFGPLPAPSETAPGGLRITDQSTPIASIWNGSVRRRKLRTVDKLPTRADREEELKVVDRKISGGGITVGGNVAPGTYEAIRAALQSIPGDVRALDDAEALVRCRVLAPFTMHGSQFTTDSIVHIPSARAHSLSLSNMVSIMGEVRDDYTRRYELAEILERIAAEGLDGPRDLDVALDAIEALFDADSDPVDFED